MMQRPLLTSACRTTAFGPCLQDKPRPLFILSLLLHHALLVVGCHSALTLTPGQSGETCPSFLAWRWVGRRSSRALCRVQGGITRQPVPLSPRWKVPTAQAQLTQVQDSATSAAASLLHSGVSAQPPGPASPTGGMQPLPPALQRGSGSGSGAAAGWKAGAQTQQASAVVAHSGWTPSTMTARGGVAGIAALGSMEAASPALLQAEGSPTAYAAALQRSTLRLGLTDEQRRQSREQVAVVAAAQGSQADGGSPQSPFRAMRPSLEQLKDFKVGLPELPP